MRKKILIISIISGLAVLAGILIWLFASKQYINAEQGFSFKYPRSWIIAESANKNKKESVFINDNVIQFSLKNYFWQPIEFGKIKEYKTYATNDPQTVLHYNYYEPVMDGFAPIVLLRWQKKCLSLPCDSKSESSGTIAINLDKDSQRQLKQLKMLEKIIKSFKIRM